MQLVRQRKTRRPLVVWLDDHISLLVDQVGHLNIRGYDVHPTQSVTGFLRALDQSVNIAIIDIKLGEIEDGTALIDLVYANRPEIGIVVHSSYPEAFRSSQYDAARVRFVKKDPDDTPVEAGDDWPLAQALTELVNTLNARQSGLKPPGVAMGNGEKNRSFLNWMTVQRLQRFATENFVLPLAVGLLFVKVAIVSPGPTVSFKSVLNYIVQVGGFALPFLVFVVLAWKLTPWQIREANSPGKFVQLNLERANADPDFRSDINKDILANGIAVPQDDFSALVTYYEIETMRRVWLARILIAIFFLGVAYLGYDIILDLIHLGKAEDGH